MSQNKMPEATESGVVRAAARAHGSCHGSCSPFLGKSGTPLMESTIAFFFSSSLDIFYWPIKLRIATWI